MLLFLIGVIGIFGVVRCWENGLCISSFADGHVVFFCEICGIDLVVVEYELFVLRLLLGCIVHAVVPFEGDAPERESVAYHSRNELVVDHIA